MSLKRFINKFTDWLPRSIFANFQTVIIEKNNTSSRSKQFSGSSERYQFEFVCKQNNTFSFRIGKMSKLKAGRFEGAPMEKKTVSGKGTVKKIIVPGSKFNIKEGDFWLVKVKCETFAKRNNTLEIYYSKFKG